jgi:outer membrane receptor protein involved in Fe transport
MARLCAVSFFLTARLRMWLLAALLVVVPGFSTAQPGQGSRGPYQGPTATITGQVFDADLSVPIEYANVVLYRQRDSSQVTGAITTESGRYELPGLPPGRYYIEVSFIGYRGRTLKDIQVAPGARLDLGRTELRQVAVEVKGVETTAERPQLSYRIDKKVVDVGRMATAASGTAVDVLENVPSVKVDVEGNVSLRGSQNFAVLIDGKPSPIEGSDALQQIPAPTIDKIEIITNPSAKYDPEGVSGIINVILKKQRQAGISGIATVDGGWPRRYGGSFLLNYRLNGLSLFGGGDLRRGSFPGSRRTESWTKSGDTTTWSTSEGDGDRAHNSYGLRAGGDYKFSENDRTSLSLRFGDHGFGMSQQANYRRWDSRTRDTAFEVSHDSSERGGVHLAANLEHQHRFGREGHQLLASASYTRRTGDDRSTNLLSDTSGRVLSGLRQKETGPRQPIRLKLDYTLPLRGEDRLEAGVSGAVHRARSESRVWEYDRADDSFHYRPEYSQVVRYADNISAAYTQFAGKRAGFGFQPGLRVEHSDRLVSSDSGDYPFRRWDYFPTLHLSYDLPAHQQVMVSYTRRIERPRGWELWPFLSRQDAYNVRRGNPALKPEITDAFEAGWQAPLGASRISAEGYYRITHDKVERIRSVYEPGVILHSAANVGADYSLGTELLLDLQLFKWWRMNLSGDVYDYRVTGELNGQDFSNSSFNWDGRFSNDFSLPTQSRFQLNVRYESPKASAQGTEAGRLMTDAAIRQQFLNRQLSVTLQARDLLGTGGFESTAEGTDFRNYFQFRPQSPVFSLNLTWNFNNYRPERRRQETDVEEPEREGEY